MGIIFIHCYRVSAFLYFTGIILFHCYRVSVFLYFTGIIFVHCYRVSVFLYFTVAILFDSYRISILLCFTSTILFHCYSISIIPRYTSTIFIQKNQKNFSIGSIHLKILRPLVSYFVNTRFLISYEKLNRSGIKKNPLTTATKHCNKRILFILFGWAFPIQHTASHIGSSVPIVF